jgi:hypothetical protein
MPAVRPSLAIVACLLLTATPAFAQSRGWSGPGWDSPRAGGWSDQRLSSNSRDDREGKVDAESFAAVDVGDALGHGAITVSTLPSMTPGAADGAAFEAALVDQLVKAGYDTTAAAPEGGQQAEIRIVRDVLLPEEQRRKPVSGEAMIGMGTYGSSMGLALSVDLRKPRKALVSTRMDVRIIDKASGKALWEGRAEMATREGDKRWNEQAIAGRLSSALFKNFPNPTVGSLASR